MMKVLEYSLPFGCRWTLVAGLALALSLPFPGEAQVQNKDQQKCINALNKSVAKVAKGQSKNIDSCIKDWTKDKLGSTLEACLIADRKSKVGKARQKTRDLAAKKCADTPPDFGPVDPNTINTEAVQLELDLIHSLFGPNLDTVIVMETDPNVIAAKDIAKCQRAVAKASMKCQDTALKVFNKCKKSGLKDETVLNADDLDACLAQDPDGKIAKDCDPSSGKIRGQIQKRCVDKGVGLLASFPRCVTDDPNSLGSCISRAVTLRTFEAVNCVDGLGFDCDDPNKTDLTLANLNILHGGDCSLGGCRQSDRLDLLFDWIVDAGCPDVVLFQEVTEASPLRPDLNHIPKIDDLRSSSCPFPYRRVYLPSAVKFDEEMILSRFPVLFSTQLVLYRGFRKVLHARIRHPIGDVDVFTTHLASGSDFATDPCGPTCPAECVSAGANTNRECQAVQLADFVETVHDVDAPAVVAGDFNSVPGSFEYLQFTDSGWIDVHLAAGNPECVPATGIGCTSGRDSSTLAEMESTAANVARRIDYAFLVPPGPSSGCSAVLDGPTDPDGDGTATQIFTDDPNPFAPSCGPSPLPMCWPSDHEGVELDLNCD